MITTAWYATTIMLMFPITVTALLMCRFKVFFIFERLEGRQHQHSSGNCSKLLIVQGLTLKFTQEELRDSITENKCGAKAQSHKFLPARSA